MTSSAREEIEVVTLFLGFKFVVVSILLTMPDTLLNDLQNVGLTGWFPLLFRYIPWRDAVSISALAGSLLLLSSLILYLIYVQSSGHLWISLTRSLFVVGVYFLLILIFLMDASFIMRIAGTTSMLNYVSPIITLVMVFGFIVMIAFLLKYWWYRIKTLYQKHNHKLGKGESRFDKPDSSRWKAFDRRTLICLSKLI